MSPTETKDHVQGHDAQVVSVRPSGDWDIEVLRWSQQRNTINARFVFVLQATLDRDAGETTLSHSTAMKTSSGIELVRTVIPDSPVGYYRSATVTVGESFLSKWGVSDLSTCNPRTRLFDQLAWSFMIRNPGSVQNITKEVPEIGVLALDASNHLRKYFPSERFALEPIKDPEEEIPDQLAVYVITARKPEDALLRLDQFDEDWWVREASKAQGRLMVNLEFI